MNRVCCFLVYLLIIPLASFTQDSSLVKNLTGLWKGFLATDEKKITYELVINNAAGKLSGYSHTTFTVNGETIVSVKNVNISFHKNKILVEDQDLLFDNFTDDAPKKIRQNATLIYTEQPGKLILDGNFETKVARNMRPARGNIYLEKKRSKKDSRLLPKLQEMDLAANLSFSLPEEEILVVTAPVTLPVIVATEIPMLPTKSFTIDKPIPSKKVSLNITRLAPGNEIAKRSIALLNGKQRTAVVPWTYASATVVAIAKPTTPAPSTTAASQPEKIVVPNANIAKTTVAALPNNIAVAPIVDLSARTIEIIDRLYIEADSLVLTLYDNGTVDGDSVSIIMNGKTIVSKQMLSTEAFRKTIYFTPEMGDTVQLVMYAENLGSLPPNTGLLILQYDKQRREIRFSGDLKTNAAITLTRRRKQ